MALVTEATKELKILDTSGNAAVDLSSSQNSAVIYTTSVSSGKPTFSLPAAQGGRAAGILLNDPASGARAEVRLLGLAKATANGTFNAGAELTPAGTSGKLEAASSGDYVCAIAQEAAAAANHKVSVMVIPPYQKN